MLRKFLKQPVILASAIIALALFAFPFAASAQGIPMLNVTGGPKGQQQYSLSLQLLALMTSLTLLPSFLLMMTAFVRIVIVMSILRQALGTGQTRGIQPCELTEARKSNQIAVVYCSNPRLWSL